MNANGTETDSIEFRKREVDFQWLKGKAPSPEALEVKAESTPEAPRYVCASDYFHTIKILREEKNFTWNEIAEWFARHGLAWSWASLQSAYKRIIRNQNREEEPQ